MSQRAAGMLNWHLHINRKITTLTEFAKSSFCTRT